jgi:hypothetical protein
MWEQRNAELTNLASPASLPEHARLDGRTRKEYEDVSTLATRDRHCFRRRKDVLFTESLEYESQWLESVGLPRDLLLTLTDPGEVVCLLRPYRVSLQTAVGSEPWLWPTFRLASRVRAACFEGEVLLQAVARSAGGETF